jgi:endonuclease YncB( thermonuclease family)
VSARIRPVATLALALMLLGGTVGCATVQRGVAEVPGAAASAPATTAPPGGSNDGDARPWTPAGDVQASTFVAVIDGDTVETAAGTVRIIGIDTPERGECGYDEASTALGRALAKGAAISLELPAGHDDTDRYGRLLRSISTEAGVDIGLMQIEAGLAIARYDSRDGYPAHPREEAYRAAQRATQGPNRTVVTTACAGDAADRSLPAETPAPPAPPAVPGAERWWEQYSSCTKLKQNTVGHPTGPFARSDPAQAEQYEWFAFGTGNRGDGDGDGIACEGWG